ncbi:MAG: hypothetical protein ACOYKA_01210 [Legionellaceae bacterium]
MVRYVFFLSVALILSACSGHDVRYYTLNLKALDAALAKCPSHPPAQVSCEQLDVIAQRMNQLAYLLRSDQQAYGLSILHLQKSRVEHDSVSKREALAERLAVVKWLQSPGG